MPQYSYRAVGRDGKTRDGTVEAQGPEVATRQLRAQGLTLLKLEAGAGAALAVDAAGKPPGRQAVLSLTSELAVLLRAGLPLDSALKVLIDMADQPPQERMLRDLLASVKGGKSLSQALQPWQPAVGNFYISMVRAGEAGGQLSQVLDRLVAHLETAKANRDTVISALIYPAILAVVSLLSVAVMLGFVVPQFETLFADMGEALPPLTGMVIALADIVKSYWLVLLLAAAGLFLYLRNRLHTERGRKRLHRALLRMPLVGGIVFEFEVSNFARTVGTLLGNGVPLLQSIAIGIDTVNNCVVRDSLQVLPPAVKAGRRMSRALEETGLFTPMVVQMIRVGEESGRLDQMMLELAKVFDDHVQAGVKRGLAMLEPVLILGMGFIIGIIIIAILTGILSVNDLAV